MSDLSALTTGLRDPNPVAAHRSLCTLLALGAEATPAIGDILQATQHRDPNVGTNAVLTLLYLSQLIPEAMSALTRLIRKVSEPEVRLRALSDVMHAESGEALVPILPLLIEAVGEDLDQTNRRVAMGAIAKVGRAAESAIPVLTSVLREKIALNVRSAASTLAAIGPRVVTALPELRAALKQIYSAAGRHEGELGPDSDEKMVRTSILVVLREIGMPAAAAIPEILPLLNGSDNDLREMSVQALARFGPEAVIALPGLRRAVTAEYTLLAERAIIALQALGAAAEPAVPELRQALRRQGTVPAKNRHHGRNHGAVSASAVQATKAVRRAAAVALGKIGPSASAALPDLRVALNDLDLRPEAREAIRLIEAR